VPLPRPYRLLVLGGGPAYFEASEEEKRERFLPAFRALLAHWEGDLGARVVASFCDDALQVGPAEPGRWVWYLIFEVDDVATAAAMIDAVREVRDGVRLDRYVRFEVRVGRAFWAREEQRGTIESP
jgi:hypothetical protein